MSPPPNKLTRIDRMNRKLFALAAALALTTTLGGCGLFGRGEDKKTKTPVLGQRIAVLTAETGAEVDPSLEPVPVLVPDATANAEWTQPGGSGSKSLGNVALGQALGVAWARAPWSAAARCLWSTSTRSSMPMT
jgi:hypothetical protein